MIALFGSLLGFLSAAFPDLLKIWRNAQDRKHELKILEMQIEQQRLRQADRLEEVQINADIAEAIEVRGAQTEAESQALYTTYWTGIRWVDALNGTVRPIITYSFFFLYASVKALQYSANMPWVLWTAEDQAIFSGMISFYFGQRAMAKLRVAK